MYKTWNKYMVEEMIKRDDFDPSKFYKDDLIQFLKIIIEIIKEKDLE